MNSFVRIAVLVPILAAALPAPAQNYPLRPVRLILPYVPGGGTDLVARPLAEKLGAGLGQQVIVDNRGGANGNIGMELAARAQPDGYTIVLALTAQLAINPAFYPGLPYDPVRDYAPITLLGTSPYLLTVNPALPVKTVKDLIALAKAKPGQIAFATSGTGGIPHLAGELLKSMAGIDLLHVPYKGGGPAIADVIAGQVQMNFAVISVAMAQVKGGRLRAVAVTSSKRFPALAEVPAVSETLPGYEISTWFAVLAPARTPRSVVERLNREIVAALGAPEMRAYLLGNGFDPAGSSPEQAAGYIGSELVKWAKLVKSSGVKPE